MKKLINTRGCNLFDKLDKVNLESLAKQTGFYQRKPRKVNVPLFTYAILVGAIDSKVKSLRKQALDISLLSGLTYAKQSVAKRLKPATAEYMFQLLQKLITITLTKPSENRKPDGILSFRRVFIQDSTCIKLNPALARFFPGASNQSGAIQSSLKIQATFDLLTEKFHRFSISGFRRNDQKASADILEICEKGDLIVRDLGYFVLRVFKAIQERGAYFISRFDLKTGLYDLETEEPFNLLKHLRHHKTMDQIILIGKRQKMRARIVALPVPEQVAAQRRRKANIKRKKDKRYRPSKEKLALMGWSIFITNLEIEHYNSKFIRETYELRWRIETLFKAYKQHFALSELPGKSPVHLKIQIYAKLCFITLTHVIYSSLENYTQISFMKLAQISVKLAQQQFWMRANVPTDHYDSIILYFCLYEKRKRINIYQKFHALG